MQTALLNYLACPLCHAPLELTAEKRTNDEITGGELRCTRCDSLYPIATETAFDYMLAHHVRPGIRVLEVGAAKTWAGRYFVARGCQYTGCDMLLSPLLHVPRAGQPLVTWILLGAIHPNDGLYIFACKR